jgi:hypothetical protein
MLLSKTTKKTVEALTSKLITDVNLFYQKIKNLTNTIFYSLKIGLSPDQKNY